MSRKFLNIKKLSSKEIAKEITNGNKIILSKTITLLESSRIEHNKIANEVIELLYNKTGKSIRVGITGVPGVGKSTFIESLVKNLLSQNKKIAILAIDPSSQMTKGSILGDKTRMEEISGNDNVFIRPSPAGKQLGGVNNKTRETILLCEACGYDTILIETVGVGQSEIDVNYMVDCFVLLMLATAGDELQGIKKGIMEMADILVINKADIKGDSMTTRAIQNYKNALHLFQEKKSKWTPKVKTCSALNNINITEVWKEITNYSIFTKENKYWNTNRNQQSIYWIKEIVNQRLMFDFYSQDLVKKELEKLEKKVLEGKISSLKASELILKLNKF